MTANVIDGAAMLTALQTRMDLQSEFASRLSDSINRGVSRLVDADMNEASIRLKALQAQQLLANSGLQIAHSEPQVIMTLFRQYELTASRRRFNDQRNIASWSLIFFGFQRKKTVALHLLTGKFSLAADCFSLFARFFDGWLLESFT
ncbi:hypothetical protein AYO27_24555 [Rhizobium sp. GHKF11]|nr:hypothetical protein AYO27_24555 [Rhizobium sp. GHKF11]